MTHDNDPHLAKALMRYQVISPYLAAAPKRGQRRQLLEQLARKVWIGSDGEPLTVAAETIRSWVRRYRVAGLDGLRDKPHPKRGVQVLTDAEQELICRLKKEVPERSLDRLIAIAEHCGLVETGRWRRSTVHRVLQARGLSAHKAKIPDAHDLDRFEADFPGDLWQSDLRHGPWLPDPDRPGKMRKTKLYAFLDDHSRLLLHGRFSFAEDLPHLELVFRRALQKYGKPRRVYYDNGAVYRAQHMRSVVAELGIHRIVFTQVRRPMGHGKIEALNRLIKNAFIAEVKASTITTIDALNEAFVAWADQYNHTVHSEIGETPIERWKKGLKHLRFCDEVELRRAFVWTDKRRADKAGVLHLMGVRYQVSAKLANRKLEVRFDPEALHEIEVWCDGAFCERVRPLEIHRHRRPKEPELEPTPTSDEPVADYLGILVANRRARHGTDPDPVDWKKEQNRKRQDADEAVLCILRRELDSDALDEQAALRWLDRFGPLDPAHVDQQLPQLLAAEQAADRHVNYYLHTLKETQR